MLTLSVLMISLLVAVAVIFLVQEDPETKAPGKALEAGVLQATLKINNVRYGELSFQLPLYLKCTFTNLSEEETIDVPNVENLEPVVKAEADDHTIKSKWKRVGDETQQLLPREKRSIYWICQSQVPPGSYVIALKGYPFDINPAFLKLVDKPAAKDELAYVNRKLDLIKGDQEKVIVALKKDLQARPDSIALRYQLAEAYGVAGQEEEKKKQMREVVYRIQQAQEKHHKKTDIPDWIVFLTEN